MFCKKCGTENDDNAVSCTNCNYVLNQPQVTTEETEPAEVIPNYLVQSILVTLFCCLPFGIAAIVFAAQVNGKVQAHDYDGARESARKAKMWCWWSFGLGLVGQLTYFIAVIAMAAAEAY